MERLYTDVRFCVADLQPGFDAIADYSASTLLHLNSIPALKKIMAYLLENGLREIVRILSEDQLSYRQILNMAAHVQGYKPLYADSLEEAEEKLVTHVHRKAMRVDMHAVTAQYRIGSRENKGRVIDMSISGCAVEVTADSLAPELGEEILLQAEFPGNDDDGGETISIKSKVVRVEATFFAVTFSDLGDEESRHLWKLLLAETRR